MKFVELSHRISNGMVTFPGVPAVKIDTYMDMESSAKEFGANAGALLDRIEMVNINGTYLDAPLHRSPDGYSIADIPLEKLVDLPFDVVTMKEGSDCFDAGDIENIGQAGGAVILNSGHYKKFGTDAYAQNPPYLTLEAAKALVAKGVVFIGIDSPLIDNMETLGTIGCTVHDEILSAGGVICEDMTNLDALAGVSGTLTAVPAPVEMASFAARVFVKNE